MLFWDPYFGWDWHGMRSAFSGLVVLCFFASFISVTEGHRWFAPYLYLYDAIVANAAMSIGASMLLFIMGFWYWRFQSGDY